MNKQNPQYKKLKDNNLRDIYTQLFTFRANLMSLISTFFWSCFSTKICFVVKSERKLCTEKFQQKKNTRQTTFMILYFSFTRYARLHSSSMCSMKIQEYKKKKSTYSQLLFRILHTLIHRIHHQVPLGYTLQLYNSPLPPRVYGMTGKKCKH